MKKYIKTSIVAFAAALLMAPSLRAEKNMLDVEYRDLPANYEALLQQEPGKWSFNFCPYGGDSAAFLWTDPILQREAVSGESVGDKAPTALFVSCNQEGFTVLVFAGEPKFKECLEKGSTLPASRLECFFAPGDADTSKIEHYYQFICSATEKVEGIYPWLVDDRSFRSIEGHLQIDSHTLPNGNMVKIFIPWAPLFDRLPFSEKRDNFWRLSVIRWASSGGQTWGGVVHAANSAGYIRFPNFTDEQKTAIRKTTLLKAWTAYQKLANSTEVSPKKVPPRKEEYYVKTIATLPHTYMNVNEDFGFREAWLEKAIAERNALGAGIADFDKMSQAEQEAFYKKASDMLFNFGYDLDSAYAEYLNSKIFKR
ncbi:MAG: hypothetical protein A2X49_08295 [Lentisphaerae bacterium GWF2_52_8]|nr:MAG: hypothetical protein A2X49_08295 [Lentisphaerae bacterium GWF2_52_8]